MHTGLTLQTVVCGLFVNQYAQVLFTQRMESSSHPWQWEIPGGKVEPAEQSHEAVKRELHEELGPKDVRVGPIISTCRIVSGSVTRNMILYGVSTEEPLRPLASLSLKWVYLNMALERMSCTPSTALWAQDISTHLDSRPLPITRNHLILRHSQK